MGYFSGIGVSGYESSTIEYLKCFMFDLDEAPCLTVSLQLALDSARFEFTLKMRLNRI